MDHTMQADELVRQYTQQFHYNWNTRTVEHWLGAVVPPTEGELEASSLRLLEEGHGHGQVRCNRNKPDYTRLGF